MVVVTAQIWDQAVLNASAVEDWHIPYEIIFRIKCHIFAKSSKGIITLINHENVLVLIVRWWLTYILNYKTGSSPCCFYSDNMVTLFNCCVHKTLPKCIDRDIIRLWLLQQRHLQSVRLSIFLIWLLNVRVVCSCLLRSDLSPWKSVVAPWACRAFIIKNSLWMQFNQNHL